MTPPPTETPAPLSDGDEPLSDVELAEVRARREEALVTPHSERRRLQDLWGHEDRARLLATVAALRARNEALEDALEAVKFYATETPEAVKRTAARLYTLKTPTEDEAAIVLDAANVILGQAGRLARHVAALQEIGKGVEADQATIARLSEELAQADARAKKAEVLLILSWNLEDAINEHPHDNIGRHATEIALRYADDPNVRASSTLRQAIARHRARHDTEGREG